ncbi:MAG TPA: type II toxin-antitoxin system death-on-curing family toxin [Gemmatimonadaceae bacterium]|nr:type II toxin-antitoxin system death-on-curing family toxin [Gemmatimonadaceae bacterium]
MPGGRLPAARRWPARGGRAAPTAYGTGTCSRRRSRAIATNCHIGQKSDFADLAAAYLVGLVRNHGFVDGNKRTGLAGSLVFLGLNDLALHAAPAELHALVMRVATTQLDDDAVAGYLRHRITARG